MRKALVLWAVMAMFLAGTFFPVSAGAEEKKTIVRIITCGNVPQKINLEEYKAYPYPPNSLYAGEVNGGKDPDQLMQVRSILFRRERGIARVFLADGSSLMFIWAESSTSRGYQQKSVGGKAESFYFPVAEGKGIKIFSPKTLTSWIDPCFDKFGVGYPRVLYPCINN